MFQFPTNDLHSDRGLLPIFTIDAKPFSRNEAKVTVAHLG